MSRFRLIFIAPPRSSLDFLILQIDSISFGELSIIISSNIVSLLCLLFLALQINILIYSLLYSLKILVVYNLYTIKHSFKLQSQLNFDKYVHPCSHYPNQEIANFCHSSKHSHTAFQTIHSPCNNHCSDFYLHRFVLPVLELPINEIIQYIFFHLWLFCSKQCF